MKQYHRYQMDFEGKWSKLSAIFMGVAVFLLAVYYLGVHYLGDFSGGVLFLKLWLPLILGGVYIVLLHILRWNAPGVYAIVGCALCLLLLIDAFSAGGVLRILLAVVGYVVSGAVLVLCAGGFLPGRVPAAVCFTVVLAIRFLFFSGSGDSLITEAADLSVIAALACLPKAMKPGTKH